jgi:hypothetical protein
MKYILIILLAIAAAACSPLNVSYDYDRSTNFNAYKTYNYEDNMKIDTVAYPFFKDRAIRAIDAEMRERGYTKSNHPDMLVDLHIKTENRDNALASTNDPYMVGPWPWRFGYAGGFSTTRVNYDDYVEGTLFINIVDANKEKIVWQGRATKTLEENLTPEQREKNVNAAIDQIFERYPVHARK